MHLRPAKKSCLRWWQNYLKKKQNKEKQIFQASANHWVIPIMVFQLPRRHLVDKVHTATCRLAKAALPSKNSQQQILSPWLDQFCTPEESINANLNTVIVTVCDMSVEVSLWHYVVPAIRWCTFIMNKILIIIISRALYKLYHH